MARPRNHARIASVTRAHVLQRIDPDRRLGAVSRVDVWTDEVGAGDRGARRAGRRFATASCRCACHGAAWMQELQFAKEEIRDAAQSRGSAPRWCATSTSSPARAAHRAAGADQRAARARATPLRDDDRRPRSHALPPLTRMPALDARRASAPPSRGAHRATARRASLTPLRDHRVAQPPGGASRSPGDCTSSISVPSGSAMKTAAAPKSGMSMSVSSSTRTPAARSVAQRLVEVVDAQRQMGEAARRSSAAARRRRPRRARRSAAARCACRRARGRRPADRRCAGAATCRTARPARAARSDTLEAEQIAVEAERPLQVGDADADVGHAQHGHRVLPAGSVARRRAPLAHAHGAAWPDRAPPRRVPRAAPAGRRRRSSCASPA